MTVPQVKSTQREMQAVCVSRDEAVSRADSLSVELAAVGLELRLTREAAEVAASKVTL